MKITIFMIDDHKLILEAWTELLNKDGRFSVIGATADCIKAIETIKEKQPDIVITDINMSPVDGFEITHQIRSLSNRSAVIAVSVFSELIYARKMFQAGALGYVTKNSSKEELIEALLRVSRGERYICREIQDMLVDRLMEDEPQALSKRELDIMNGIRDGLSSQEISEELGIAIKTVDVHRHNILKKLGLPNAAALVNYMHQHRI